MISAILGMILYPAIIAGVIFFCFALVRAFTRHKYEVARPSSAPVCGPDRSCTMTGMYMENHAPQTSRQAEPDDREYMRPAYMPLTEPAREVEHDPGSFARTAAYIENLNALETYNRGAEARGEEPIPAPNWPVKVSK